MTKPRSVYKRSLNCDVVTLSWNSRIGKCAKRGAAEQCPPQYQKKGTNECQAPTIYEAVVTLQLIALPTTTV